ncbi:outer membrane beta-barrel protein [Helicobacter cetorum]|uniref:Outer membrane protein n=1 Tax=Helicobacter cetorum (strain ATCC BAA-429 / MIT 00-7128) TaxID=182217 RepID=I0EN78_HELC0|nr:outer membrane beta-barrel protein [Helicobacter cetorum]AFI04397.1 hypothetical protein HCW_05675 [Helicobacter cetorum MIT 00-7128]
MKKIVVSGILASLLATALMAEDTNSDEKYDKALNNSVYGIVGFQYGQMSHAIWNRHSQGDPGYGQTNIGNGYGVNVSLGWQGYFGKTKRWGFRIAGVYEYMYSNPAFGGGQMNIDTYGAYSDILLKFAKFGKHYVSAYLGTALLGQSFGVKGASYMDASMNHDNNKIHQTYFQIPIRVGVIVSLAKHLDAQFGFEIPLARGTAYNFNNANGDMKVTYTQMWNVNYSLIFRF